MKILCFGDSITKGYTRFGTEYYPYSDYLKNELLKHDDLFSTTRKLEIIESGMNGETVVTEMEERLNHLLLLADSLGQPYDYVILLGGLNDMAEIMMNEKELNDVIHAFRNLYQLLDNNNYIKKYIHITIPICLLDSKDNGNNPYSISKNMINDMICDFHSPKKIPLNLRDHDLYQLNPFYMNQEQKDLYWDDGLHFTKDGYLLLAIYIYNVFKKEILLK